MYERKHGQRYAAGCTGVPGARKSTQSPTRSTEYALHAAEPDAHARQLGQREDRSAFMLVIGALSVPAFRRGAFGAMLPEHVRCRVRELNLYPSHARPEDSPWTSRRKTKWPPCRRGRQVCGLRIPSSRFPVEARFHHERAWGTQDKPPGATARSKPPKPLCIAMQQIK